MKASEAKERLEKQYKRQNEYIKNNYDRMTVTLPKGTKERIKERGESVNGLVNRLISEYLDGTESEDEDLPDFAKD